MLISIHELLLGIPSIAREIRIPSGPHYLRRAASATIGVVDKHAEASAPVLTSWGPGPTRLTFSAARRLHGDDMVEYDIDLSAEGLTARCSVISLGDRGDGLPEFVEQLAADFRGWTGARAWHSLEDQLRIEATWRSGGHVALDVHLSPGIHVPWTVRAEFLVEAGAQMQALASSLAHFFGSDRRGPT